MRAMSNKTFHIKTFGCQMNANDSDWLTRSLVDNGFSPASFEDARIHILMTCSVRGKPENKVYSELGQIKMLAKEHPERDIFACVGGCVAQQAGLKLFPRLKELKLVFGTDGIAQAPAAIAMLSSMPNALDASRITLLDFTDDIAEREHKREVGEQSPSAFINIMQGCNNFCSYCIVPFVRGKPKSRKTSAVLDECKEVLALGARELTLLGQNVNSFGQDAGGDGTSFTDLLYKVAALPGLLRLRFVTSHPKDMAPELIRAFAELPVLAPSLHLPLQSGSDRILKIMGRKYDLARYMGLVDSLREARPEIELSTDIITGFPGETDEDFEATMQAMQRADYLSSFSFVYSDRPGTKATSLPDKVERKVALDRLSRLQKWQNSNMDAKLARRIGGKASIILEGSSARQDILAPGEAESLSWHGKDEFGLSVNVVLPADAHVQIGDQLVVRITGQGRHTLKAEALPTD